MVRGRVASAEGEIDLPLGRHPEQAPWQCVNPSAGKPSLTKWAVRGLYRSDRGKLAGMLGEFGYPVKAAGHGEERVERIGGEAGGHEDDDVLTCMDLWPITGRSHQLRVHMAAIGRPILGDRFYGDGEFWLVGCCCCSVLHQAACQMRMRMHPASLLPYSTSPPRHLSRAGETVAPPCGFDFVRPPHDRRTDDGELGTVPPTT